MSTRVDLTGLSTEEIDSLFRRVGSGEPEPNVAADVLRLQAAHRYAEVNTQPQLTRVGEPQ